MDEPDTLARQPWITPADLVSDIERMIGGLVKPYIDISNPLMHEDELRAECRAKLARILYAGHLNRCPTRAKAFGFIKTSLGNHVRSLVQKHAFTEKRTGAKPPPKQPRSATRWNFPAAAKVVCLSLDDDEDYVQVGKNDPAFRRMEFLEELDQMLTEEERCILNYLMRTEQVGYGDLSPKLLKNRFRALVASIRVKLRTVLHHGP